MDAVPAGKGDARTKPMPSSQAAEVAPLALTYVSAPDKVDSNLVILLHGLGDTEAPFVQLGSQLQRNLPQTAILVVRGGHAVPFMDGQSWGYWDVWDGYGQEIAHPNPTTFLHRFSRLIDFLVRPASNGGCGWPSTAIHVFGFAHGATAAMEGVVAWVHGQQLAAGADKRASTSLSQPAAAAELGSVVSICGELLSHPTFSPPLSTPLLAFARTASPSANLRLLQRAFAHVEVASFPPRADPLSGSATSPTTEASMPASDPEWASIMRFWARFLRNRSTWELEGGLYEVAQPATAASSSSS